MDGKWLHCIDIGDCESNQTNAPAAGITLAYAYREPAFALRIGAGRGFGLGTRTAGV
jgi:hypothetical protein